MVDDTVTLTIKNGKTAQFQITLTDSIENISFIKSSYQLTQNETQTIAIDNYDTIKNQTGASGPAGSTSKPPSTSISFVFLNSNFRY